AAFRCGSLRSNEGVTPKFGRRHAGISLEGTIERSDRLESGVHCDGQHLYVPLARVGQSGLSIVYAVAVEERVEVAIAQPFVDHWPEWVSGRVELGCRPAYGETFLPVNALHGHQILKAAQQNRGN